MSCSVGRE